VHRGLAITAAIALLTVGAACTGNIASPTPPPTRDPTAVFQQLLTAINTGNADQAASLLADGAEIFGNTVTTENREQVARTLTCTADVISAAGNGDTTRVTVRFTGKSPMATGPCNAAAGSQEVLVVSVRDGKVVSLQAE
jgi:hypothetical protein